MDVILSMLLFASLKTIGHESSD